MGRRWRGEPTRVREEVTGKVIESSDSIALPPLLIKVSMRRGSEMEFLRHSRGKDKKREREMLMRDY